MRFKRNGTTMTVDIHGMSAAGAEELLLSWLSHAPQEIGELRVIHGCNQGTVLREMVRNRLSHPRIKTKLPALNPGETRLVLAPSHIRQNPGPRGQRK